MIHPDKVKEEAKKKADENYKFRSYLKGHADERELDRQFMRLHKELCLLIMIAVNVGIAAKCIEAVSRRKTWKEMQSI